MALLQIVMKLVTNCKDYAQLIKMVNFKAVILFIRILKYNWEGVNFPWEKDNWKKFAKNDVAIAINVLYTKKEKTDLDYVSKHNSNCEKQAILLMIPNGEKWHYLAVNILSALLRGIISQNNDDFYCLNCLHSFKKNWIALKSMKK